MPYGGVLAREHRRLKANVFLRIAAVSCRLGTQGMERMACQTAFYIDTALLCR